MTGIVGCCALAAIGHVAALPSPAMNSLRRISDLPRLHRQPIAAGAACLGPGTQSFLQRGRLLVAQIGSAAGEAAGRLLGAKRTPWYPARRKLGVPRIWDCLAERRYGEISWTGSCDDGGKGLRPRECERREKSDMPFDLSLALRNLGKRSNAVRGKLIDPAARFGDGEENGVAGL
jgi:hypothetical protein